MNAHVIIDNLKNPALLFFVLGLFSSVIKSDLKVPESSSKFIALYLLFALGFKGGQELTHNYLIEDIYQSFFIGISLALIIPCIVFLLTKHKLGIHNSTAVAASYGSVSAVTFITAVSFLEMNNINYSGNMIAVMALMEAPAIVVGLIMLNLCRKDEHVSSLTKVLKHAFTNSSVVLILGSLLVGMLSSDQQAQGIKPFTTDLFVGFLCVFLLDMGIKCGSKIKSFLKNSVYYVFLALLFPLLIGTIMALICSYIDILKGDALLFCILGASASYIAVPASMKLAVPKADEGIFVPMALAITFPFNICIGIPYYFFLINAL